MGSNFNVRVETITPEMAGQLLTLNNNNRRLRKEHVDSLAKAMRQHEWKLNGDAIRVGDGVLIDGQHRLAACVKSGKSFQTLIIEGIGRDVFDTIDKGMKRKISDSLYVRGEKNTAALAGIIQMLIALSKGTFAAGRNRFSDVEVENYLEANPLVIASCSYASASKIRALRLLPPSIVGSLHFLFSQKDQDLATLFFDHLGNGGIFPDASPPNILRERLISNATSSSKARPVSLAAWTIKAWNAIRQDKKMVICRFYQGEDFPGIY